MPVDYFQINVPSYCDQSGWIEIMLHVAKGRGRETHHVKYMVKLFFFKKNQFYHLYSTICMCECLDLNVAVHTDHVE